MQIANTPEDSSEEPDFVDDLLRRQDEVITELDQLETAILSVIDKIGSEREDVAADDEEAADGKPLHSTQSSQSKAA